MARLLDIRPEERRSTLFAFFTLLGVTAGHTLLETARDALFLAKLPASQLPWVYLGIAAAGLVISEVNKRSRDGAKGRLGLPMSLLGAAVITTGFWALAGDKGTKYLYALYLWTGIFASWVIVQFWLLLGDRYTVAQAKRLYGVVGTGSVLGAVAGAAVARALAEVLPAEQLLLGTAALLVATALGPALLLARDLPDSAGRTPGVPSASAPRGSLAGDLRVVTGHAYVKRILVLILLGTVTVTAVDYLFKAAVARRIEPAELGAYFANVYVVLNSIALVVQLFAVGWILRTFGVQRAVLIMPVLVFLFAGGAIAGGGLVAALLLKGSDGALRHSLQRTSTELLFVPIPDAIRSRAKPFIDLVGQRGGQALASLGILGMVALGAGEVTLSIAISIAAATWAGVALGLRRHYLDLFRATLREGRVDDRGDLPELDLTALEALFSALNSKKDGEVICALDLLAAQRRQRLIPALILYHPSRNIVLRALHLFVREGRTDFIPITDRLLVHPDIEVRTAALRARATVEHDEPFLRSKLDDECLEVRVTALVCLIAGGSMVGEEADRALGAVVSSGAPATRIALARAVSADPSPRVMQVLEELIRAPEAEVRLEVARAMGRTRNPGFIPTLIPLLLENLEGAGARDALVEIGAPALRALDAALADPAMPRELRWSLPRAVSMFAPEDAAQVLVRQLAANTDGMLRYRILRGLRRLRSLDPDLTFDKKVLWGVTEETVRRAFELLAWRLQLERVGAPGGRSTPALQLLVLLLRDKEVHTVGRVLRLLGLLFPRENFERIQRGLTSRNAKARASSRELIENIVNPPLRSHIVALIDDAPDADRLAVATPPFRPESIDLPELLGRLAARGDEVGTLAVQHAIDVGLEGVAPAGAGVPGGLMPELMEKAARTAAPR